MRVKRTDVGVIVTETLPKGQERLGLVDGIWVCTLDEFKGLCAVLRDAVARVGTALAAQEGKNDKMALLYDYLTGSDFRLQVEGIVEGFLEMQKGLEAERRAMESAWKKREKQLDRVLLSTNHMFSSIQGIAGSAVRALPQLALDQPELLDSPDT